MPPCTAAFLHSQRGGVRGFHKWMEGQNTKCMWGDVFLFFTSSNRFTLLYAVASLALDTGSCAPTPSLDFQQFHFSSFWSKSESQLSKHCVVCEISYSADVNNTYSLQLLRSVLHQSPSHRAAAAPGSEIRRDWVRYPIHPHDLISSFSASHNKSWRRHWIMQLSEIIFKISLHIKLSGKKFFTVYKYVRNYFIFLFRRVDFCRIFGNDFKNISILQALS